MGETAIIAVCAGGFGCLSWLLGISYSLGRHAARVDSIERATGEMRDALRRIFERLDSLARDVPHACTQEARLAVLEAGVSQAWRHEQPEPGNG